MSEINWEEVEKKVSIICRKFSNIDRRFKDDLAQELRIHAYYKSDDYYDLQRRAIDYWRTLRKKVMPESLYLDTDLEILGGSVYEDYTRIEFNGLVNYIRKKLKEETKRKYDREINKLAETILDIILSDIEEADIKISNLRDWKKYAPYHNKRISCSYLWEVLGEKPGDISYSRIRRALKLLESVVIELSEEGLYDLNENYKREE